MIAVAPRSQTSLVCTAFFLVAVAAVSAATLTREPAWGLAAIAVVPAAVFVARRWPMALMAALMFVGNFKTTPARGISVSDPTFVVYLLCAAAVTFELLFDISGATEWPLHRLLSGQALTILLFATFFTWVVASLAYTPALAYGTDKATRFAVFEVFSFFAPLVLLTSRERLRQLLWCIVVLSIALAARDFLDLLHPTASVLSGNTDITHIGDGMLFGSALLILVFSPPTRSRRVRPVLVGILCAAMLIAAARSPIVALLFALLITAIFMKRERAVVSRRWLFIGTIGAVALSAVVLLWMQTLPDAAAKVRWKERELVAFAGGSPRVDGTMLERMELNRSALRATMEHPLLGLGVGGWSIFYSKAQTPLFPHDFLIEVAAEEGLIGFSLLVVLLAMLFAKAKTLLSAPTLAFLFPLFAFLVSYNMMTGDLENRQLWFWFGMTAAAPKFLCDPAFLD